MNTKFYQGCDTGSIFVGLPDDNFMILDGRGPFARQDGGIIRRSQVMAGSGAQEITPEAMKALIGAKPSAMNTLSDELLPCPFCGKPAEVNMSRGFRALQGGKLHSGVSIYCSAQCHVELMLSRADLPEYDDDQLLAILAENWNRRSAHPAVRVKGLFWQPIGPEGSDVEAITELGTYTLSFDAPTAGGATNLWMAGADNATFTVFEKRAEAKAAAQADYERRIISSLDLSPAEPVAWQSKLGPQGKWADDPLGFDADFRAKSIAAGAQYRPLYAAPPQPVVTDAARDVLAERQRQVSSENWTPAHDDAHDRGELAAAAGCYALGARLPTHEVDGPGTYVVPDHWPWDGEWWKPGLRRRDLVKSGALILAEIERLDRAAALSVKPQSGENRDEP